MPDAFTPREKRQSAEREVAMRQSVYPKWVAARKMSQATADREIAMMKEIAADYRATEESA